MPWLQKSTRNTDGPLFIDLQEWRMTFLGIIAVATGGAAGALLRYAISHAIAMSARLTFPLGTFVVNAAGCLVIGFLMAGPMRLVRHPQLELLLITGLLGALTTFSTFSLETVILFQRGSYGAAALNVGLSVVVAIGAVLAGGALARLLARLV